MVNTMSLKELRPSLPKVVKQIDDKMDRYIVTKRGKPVLVMLSIEDYEAMLETIEILTDPKAVASIRQGEEDARRGRTHSWKEVKHSLEKL